MSATVPLMPFLRPLGLPRPSTLCHLLRFSTTTHCRAEAQPAQSTQAEDPNLTASRTASPTYPPNTLTSLPRPKESRASHRTAHPRPTRAYPTRQPTHTVLTSRKLIPEPITPLPPAQCAPNLPYYVTRTGSNELPVYHDTKRGGNLKLTVVRKVEGRSEVLRDELSEALGLGEEGAKVNGATGHVILRGHWKVGVERFLRERRF